VNDEDRQRITRINAWFAAQPIVTPLNDDDLYYAREPARSMAQGYVTRLKPQPKK
jgi:hypothetical protein